jgi:endo-1,4-beta-xylanase
MFLQNLKARLGRGVPIQAVGLQSHLWASVPSYGDDFVSFVQRVGDMGLKVLITELDVTDSDVPGDVATRDNLVARNYHDYLSAMLSQKSVIAVLTWGLSDRYTYLTKYKPRKDGGPVRPLPLDPDFNPAPAWSAMAQAFDGAPQR